MRRSANRTTRAKRLVAEMTVAYRFPRILRDACATAADPAFYPRRVRRRPVQVPRKPLELHPVGENSCEIGFDLAYEFRSRALQMLMGQVFDRAFRKFVTAFDRARTMFMARPADASSRRTRLKRNPKADRISDEVARQIKEMEPPAGLIRTDAAIRRLFDQAGFRSSASATVRSRTTFRPTSPNSQRSTRISRTSPVLRPPPMKTSPTGISADPPPGNSGHAGDAHRQIDRSARQYALGHRAGNRLGDRADAQPAAPHQHRASPSSPRWRRSRSRARTLRTSRARPSGRPRQARRCRNPQCRSSARAPCASMSLRPAPSAGRLACLVSICREPPRFWPSPRYLRAGP